MSSCTPRQMREAARRATACRGARRRDPAAAASPSRPEGANPRKNHRIRLFDNPAIRGDGWSQSNRLAGLRHAEEIAETKIDNRHL